MNRLEAIEARSKWLLDTHVADLAVGGISIGTGQLLTALKATVGEDIPALLAVVRNVMLHASPYGRCPACSGTGGHHFSQCPLAALLREEEVPE